MFSGRYYICHIICCNMSRDFDHANSKGLSGMNISGAAQTPGAVMFLGGMGGGNTRPNATPRVGGGSRWVKTPRASRLFERSGVQRFVGVDELQNCHVECNAPAMGIVKLPRVSELGFHFVRATKSRRKS